MCDAIDLDDPRLEAYDTNLQAATARRLLALQEDDTNLHAATCRAILQSPERARVLEQVALLCPVQLSDVPPDMLEVSRQAHTSTLETLRAVEAQRTADGLSDDELLRLVLAMQLNAFYSGVYIRLALVNHACKPNCHKFAPQGSSTRSEIVATRDIDAGEEILINYVQPFGQSAARRRVTFEEQHLWPMVPSVFPPDLDALRASPSDPDYAQRLQDVGALEQALEVAAVAWDAGSLSVGEALPQLRSLLATADALLGPRHLVQARVRQMLLDAIQRAAVEGKASADDLVLLIKAARELLPIQEAALGAVHCDIASTLDALSQAMEYMMANHTRALLAAYPEEWTSFAKASKAQFAYSKRGKAIQKLYAR